MISIQSERLQLIALNHSDLVLWKNKGREALELSLGLTPNNLELEEFYRNETSKALHDFWIPQTRKFPFDFSRVVRALADGPGPTTSPRPGPRRPCRPARPRVRSICSVRV